MKKYCIIPARSGSKGLPNKNILFFDRKPLLRHTIDAATNSGCFERNNVYLSTDSEYYYSLVGDSNINLHLRDEHLSNDNAPSSAFMLDFLENVVEDEDAIVILCQPTSPLRYSFHIKEAMEKFENSDCTCVVSVNKLDKSPRLFSEIKNGYISDLEGIDKGYRRQDENKELYIPNGALFITTKKFYIKNITFFDEKTLAYIMDDKSSIDIDGLVDFHSALGNKIQDFPNKLYETLENHTRFLDNIVVTNRSVLVGDSRLSELQKDYNFSKSGFLLHSYEKFLSNIHDSDVFLALGINDYQYGYTTNQILKKYADIVNNLLENSNKVTIFEIIETLNRPLFNNEEIKKLNYELSKFEDIRFVKLNNIFCDEHGLIFNKTYDGLHLEMPASVELYRIVEKIVENKIIKD